MVTTQVTNEVEPALTVGCGADGEWRLAGSITSGTEYVPAHLHHVVETDPTIIDVLDLKSGESASRVDINSEWRRRRTGGVFANWDKRWRRH